MSNLCFMNLDAEAARFPNAIERVVEVSGEEIKLLAEVLGLDKSNPKASLGLAESDAWAIYLLKQDTKTPLSNSKDQPQRFNTIEYSEDGIPSLKIGSFWLDLATSLPNSKPGSYSFTSHYVDASSEKNDDWFRAFEKLSLSETWVKIKAPHSGDIAYQKVFNSKDGASINLIVVHAKDYTRSEGTLSYQIRIEYSEVESKGK